MNTGIEVKRVGENMYEIIIPGEDHTLGNLLAEKLSKINGVKLAYYTQPHPLENKIIVHLTLEEGDPVKFMEEALNEIIDDVNEFMKQYIDALKSKGINVEDLVD